MEPLNNQSESINTTPVISPSPAKRSSNVVKYVLVVLLVGAAAAGVYLWQNSKVKTLTRENIQQNEQITELKSSTDLDEASTSHTEESEANAVNNDESATHKELVTGQVTQATSEADVKVDCAVLAGSLTDLWVQYGDTVNLGKETPHDARELALGEEGTYGYFSFLIPANNFEVGKTVFYRCAGKTTDGAIYAGVASFATKK